MTDQAAQFQLTEAPAGKVILALAGNWAVVRPKADGSDSHTRLAKALGERLAAGRVDDLHFATDQLTQWDSRMLVLILKLEKLAREHQVKVHREDLPAGIIKMLQLSEAVPPKETKREKPKAQGFLQQMGSDTLRLFKNYGMVAGFVGESVLSLGRFMRGSAIYYRKDFVGFLRQAGPEALGIIFLINLLMGVILAFLGAVQLAQFGATIYVADMVAIGLTREIVPMMTAIIIAGRTGAAYAAQLGTMMVNQEIDALKSFGFSPIDFLVTPRMVALSVMVPLLVIYGDAIGLLGGFLIAVGLLDISPTQYLLQSQNAINWVDILYGIVKGSFFGILVAICGCLMGMRSGRNASAVGQATTGAVVASIVCIVIATAIFSVVSNALGI